MFHCHICGCTEAEQCNVSEVFKIAGRAVLIEQIPALACSRCGEEIFSRETTEYLRQLVHSKTKPTRSISMDVFDFA